MKKIVVAIVFVVALFGLGSVNAQVKFGHVNSGEIMKLMPEMDSAQITLQNYAADLEKTIGMMQSELESKYMEYQNKRGQWSDLIRQTKEKELQDLQGRVQEFMQQADEDYKKKTQSIIEPITEKAKAAIEKVAKAGGYSYIFDTSSGAFLYTVASDDVTDKVKAALGIR